MMPRAPTSMATACAIAGLAIFAACSDGGRARPPPSESSSGSSSTGGSGATDAGSDGSGGSEGGSEGGAVDCTPVAQQGSVVQEKAFPSAAPVPLGGTLEDGTYALALMTDYGPAQDAGTFTGRAGRVTLVIAGGTLKSTGARGAANALPPETTTASTFTVSGATLQTKEVCPSAAKAGSIGFSTNGTTLELLLDSTHYEAYNRQ